MSGRKGSKHLLENEFKQIKMLLDLGVTYHQLTDITGRSANTLGIIKKSDSFEDYKRRSTMYHKPKPQEEAAPMIGGGATSVRILSQTEDNLELVRALNDLGIAMNALALSWNGLSGKLDEVLETKRPWMFGQKKG